MYSIKCTEIHLVYSIKYTGTHLMYSIKCTGTQLVYSIEYTGTQFMSFFTLGAQLEVILYLNLLHHPCLRLRTVKEYVIRHPNNVFISRTTNYRGRGTGDGVTGWSKLGTFSEPIRIIIIQYTPYLVSAFSVGFGFSPRRRVSTGRAHDEHSQLQ